MPLELGVWWSVYTRAMVDVFSMVTCMVTFSGHTGSGHHWPWYTDHHTLVGLSNNIEYSGWLGVPLGPGQVYGGQCTGTMVEIFSMVTCSDHNGSGHQP